MRWLKIFTILIFLANPYSWAGPSFIAPSEKPPTDIGEILRNASAGDIISVGFERSFFALGQMPRATGLSVIDVDTDILELTELNTKLLAHSQSGDTIDYQNHRLGHANIAGYLSPEEFGVWKSLMNGILDRHWRFNLNFEKEYLGYKILNGEFDQFDLYFNSASQLYALQILARNSRISSFQVDALSPDEYSQLIDNYLFNGRRISVFDLSNVLKYATRIFKESPWFNHPKPHLLLIAILKELRLVATSDAILIQTGYRNGETTFHGIYFSDLLDMPERLQSLYVEKLFEEKLATGLHSATSPNLIVESTGLSKPLCQVLFEK